MDEFGYTVVLIVVLYQALLPITVQHLLHLAARAYVGKYIVAQQSEIRLCRQFVGTIAVLRILCRLLRLPERDLFAVAADNRCYRFSARIAERTAGLVFVRLMDIRCLARSVFQTGIFALGKRLQSVTQTAIVQQRGGYRRIAVKVRFGIRQCINKQVVGSTRQCHVQQVVVVHTLRLVFARVSNVECRMLACPLQVGFLPDGYIRQAAVCYRNSGSPQHSFFVVFLRLPSSVEQDNRLALQALGVVHCHQLYSLAAAACDCKRAHLVVPILQ